MKKVFLLLKKALLSAFFIFSACSSCSLWQCDSICSCDPCFQSIRVYYEPQNVFREPGVEISYNTETGWLFFLNLHGCPLPTCLIKEGMIEVQVMINSEPLHVMATIYQGNQRILLPNTHAQLIIQSLLNKDTVFIRVGNYSVSLPIEGFEKRYHKMAHLI